MSPSLCEGELAGTSAADTDGSKRGGQRGPPHSLPWWESSLTSCFQTTPKLNVHLTHPSLWTKPCGCQSPQSLVLLFLHRMCATHRDFRDIPPRSRLKLHELKIHPNAKVSFRRKGQNVPYSFIYKKNLHHFSYLLILSIGKIYHQTEILAFRKGWQIINKFCCQHHTRAFGGLCELPIYLTWMQLCTHIRKTSFQNLTAEIINYLESLLKRALYIIFKKIIKKTNKSFIFPLCLFTRTTTVYQKNCSAFKVKERITFMLSKPFSYGFKKDLTPFLKCMYHIESQSFVVVYYTLNTSIPAQLEILILESLCNEEAYFKSLYIVHNIYL